MTQRQPASEFRYWAFISYSHRDKTWGRWLHKALETYRVPKRLVGMPTAAGKIPARLSPIFRDRDELPTASDLGSAIEEALRQSWCLIVICSPDSAQSRWVNEEVLAFQRLGRSDRIHCLIVDSGTDAAAPLVFPPALGNRPDADGSRIGEPVAADARRFGDGRANAKLKLVAGILGVGYDTLAQREHQRRVRNLFTVTCASLALVVVLAVSTLVAVTSRRDAVDQRTHAESLVEFMIGDLRKKLEPDGKLATLDAVGKEALAYYAAQRPETLDAEALARRARALHMIGEVYDLRGELDEALKVFEQAADSTAELVAREPGNGQRIFDHAQSVYWVGYIAYQRGIVDKAESAFEQYKKLAEQLVEIEPDNEEWQAEVGYANSNLGTLLYDQDRWIEAGEIFTKELEVAQRSLLVGSDNAAEVLRTAQAHAWLADVRLKQGQYAASAQNRLAEIALYEAMLAKNPENGDAKESLSVANRVLGTNLYQQGRTSEALGYLTDALNLALQLVARDPRNAIWTERAAQAYVAVAEIHADTGDLELARQANRDARKHVDTLLERDPSVVNWQHLSIRIEIEHVDLLGRSGQREAALHLARSLIPRIESLPGSRLRLSHRTLLLIDVLQQIGTLARGRNESDESDKAWMRVIELLTLHPDQRSPPTEAALALAYAALGKSDLANPLRTRLRELGFQRPDYLRLLAQLDVVSVNVHPVPP